MKRAKRFGEEDDRRAQQGCHAQKMIAQSPF
jgi:hypothetical protein